MAFLGHRRIPSEATKSRLLDTHAARVLGGKRKQGTPTAAVAKKTPEAQTGVPAKTGTHRNRKKKELGQNRVKKQKPPRRAVESSW